MSHFIKQSFSVLLIMIFLYSLSACQIRKKNMDGKQSQKVNTKSANLLIPETKFRIPVNSVIQAISVIKPDPFNDYENKIHLQIKFHSSRNEDLELFVLQDKQESAVYEISKSLSELDLYVWPQSKLSLNVFAKNNNANPIFEYSLKTLSHLVLARETILTSDLIGEFYSILAQSNAVIVTNGYNVNLATQRFEIEDQFRILSFKTENRSLAQVSGRSSGDIVIRAQTATGLLEIQNDGENGLDGKDGAPVSSVKASSGKNGRNADYRCFLGMCECLRNAGSGTSGANGINGNSGANGGNGGSSGNVLVKVSESNAFHVKVSIDPGLGGAAGKGSVGQLGGDPGLRGRDNFACKNPGRSGRRGVNGKRGASGQEGISGRRGTVCLVYEKNQSQCDSGR